MARNLKEAICQDIAKDLEVSLDLVNIVVQFQGEDALRAVKEFGEVEFSGFGKFYLSQNKLKNRITKLEQIIKALELHIADANTDPIKFITSSKQKESILKELEELKLRVCQK